MALPEAYQPISMGMIRRELGLINQANFSLDTAENEGYVPFSPYSTSKPNSSNPAALSEWYSYKHAWFFTTPGTYNWTAPYTGDLIVNLWGGGGGGGGSEVQPTLFPSGNNRGGPAAGGGGGAFIKIKIGVTQGTNYKVQVGSGGVGGGVQSGLTGGTGGDSRFYLLILTTDYAKATGGGGGGSNSSVLAGIRGRGATIKTWGSGAIKLADYNGGNGGTAEPSQETPPEPGGYPDRGMGGGGGAGDSMNGGNADDVGPTYSAGTGGSLYGGNGGAPLGANITSNGNNAPNSIPEAGYGYGGGGGGAFTPWLEDYPWPNPDIKRTGGYGSAGAVILYYDTQPLTG